MVKVNKERGEAALDLGGKTYRLVPTYTNLVALEEATGMGLIEMVQKHDDQSLRVNDLAKALSIVAEPEISEEGAGEAIVKGGIVDVMNSLSLFLIIALTGGGADTGKKKAVKRKA